MATLALRAERPHVRPGTLDLDPWASPTVVRAGHPTGTRKDDTVGLLTIGAFARAAQLTPKALRLYDE
jgi:PPM family protein phosphatase